MLLVLGRRFISLTLFIVIFLNRNHVQTSRDVTCTNHITKTNYEEFCKLTHVSIVVAVMTSRYTTRRWVDCDVRLARFFVSLLFNSTLALFWKLMARTVTIWTWQSVNIRATSTRLTMITCYWQNTENTLNNLTVQVKIYIHMWTMLSFSMWSLLHRTHISNVTVSGRSCGTPTR